MKSNAASSFLAGMFGVIDALAEAAAEQAQEKQALLDKIAEWNDRHPSDRIALAATSPARKCTSYRLVEDCEDIDCRIHYYEKKRIRDAKARDRASKEFMDRT